MDRAFVGEIDLESGGSTSEEDGSRNPTPSINQANKLFGRVWSGPVGFDGSSRIGDCTSSCNYVTTSPEILVEIEDPIARKKSCGGRGEKVGFLQPEKVKDKRKHSSSKKPPKPPRGPSLDAADLKLIKEISQLAMLKRARTERMKALKKMRAAKPSPINSSLYATVITILFCLVIVFQGTCSRSSSHVSFEGSPNMSVANSGGERSAQYYKNLPDGNTEGPGSLSPNFIEERSMPSSHEEGNRLVS